MHTWLAQQNTRQKCTISALVVTFWQYVMQMFVHSAIRQWCSNGGIRAGSIILQLRYACWLMEEWWTHWTCSYTSHSSLYIHPSLSISIPLPRLGFLPFFISSLKHLASFSSHLPAQILFHNPHFFGVIPSPTPSPGTAIPDTVKVNRRRPYFLQLETSIHSKQRYCCDASRCQGKCLLQTINTSGSSENYNPLKFRDNGYVW